MIDKTDIAIEAVFVLTLLAWWLALLAFFIRN